MVQTPMRQSAAFWPGGARQMEGQFHWNVPFPPFVYLNELLLTLFPAEVNAMPAWFSKVFNREDARDARAPAETAVPPPVQAVPEQKETPRRTVYALVLSAGSTASAPDGALRIKARILEGAAECTFHFDRPLLDGYSFQTSDRDTAFGCAPLAAVLYDLDDGIQGVLIHGTNLTAYGLPRDETAWLSFARRAGSAMREHLQRGAAVVLPEVLAQIPPEEEIRARLQEVIDREINPGIASHSGIITLERVEGNTAYITMGGGCQGCAASSITLRQGVEQAFRNAVPLLGALLDETDHNAGVNPFFSELPPGLG
jgi:Fe-S cluster biogenesis protein NfuA